MATLPNCVQIVVLLGRRHFRSDSSLSESFLIVTDRMCSPQACSTARPPSKPESTYMIGDHSAQCRSLSTSHWRSVLHLFFCFSRAFLSLLFSQHTPWSSLHSLSSVCSHACWSAPSPLTRSSFFIPRALVMLALSTAMNTAAWATGGTAQCNMISLLKWRTSPMRRRCPFGCKSCFSRVYFFLTFSRTVSFFVWPRLGFLNTWKNRSASYLCVAFWHPHHHLFLSFFSVMHSCFVSVMINNVIIITITVFIY